jgi:enamine deaminase RidA (YjgF/YER057c/UK114 family)
LKAEQINAILKDIYDKATTTKEEKDALLEACGCVWKARMNKVVDIGSFMNMLHEHMGFQYDVDVKTTKTETVFSVKAFINR